MTREITDDIRSLSHALTRMPVTIIWLVAGSNKRDGVKKLQ